MNAITDLPSIEQTNALGVTLTTLNAEPVMQFSTEADLEAWGYRSEAAFYHQPNLTDPRIKNWHYVREFLVPAAWNQGDTTSEGIFDSRVIEQYHHVEGEGPLIDGASPLLSLEIKTDGSDASNVVLQIARKDASGVNHILDEFTLPTDTWHISDLRIMWTTEDDGFIEWNVGGHVFRYDGPTLYGGANVYQKYGVYGQPTLIYVRKSAQYSVLG